MILGGMVRGDGGLGSVLVGNEYEEEVLPMIGSEGGEVRGNRMM